MSTERLTIEGVPVVVNDGAWSEVIGKHSGKTLSRVEFTASTTRSNDVKMVRAWDAAPQVAVADGSRTFNARLRIKSESFTEGSSRRTFGLELTEDDPAPEVRSLEIDGRVFDVLAYRENDDDTPGWTIVLKMTEAQLHEFWQRDLQNEAPAVRRIGVDAESEVREWRGLPAWSKHDEEGSTLFRQLVRLFPVGHEPLKWGVAHRTIQDNLALITLELSAKVDAVIAALSNASGPNFEALKALHGAGLPNTLSDDDRGIFERRLHQVRDALGEL